MMDKITNSDIQTTRPHKGFGLSIYNLHIEIRNYLNCIVFILALYSNT